MQRTVVVLAAVAALMFALAAPAAAHVLVVTPPGAEDPVHVGWVGGGALPGKGAGLIPGGPGGIYIQSPAHAKGLNTACESSGSDVAAIFGPPTPAGCPHGT
jgi:hypothetical protein